MEIKNGASYVVTQDNIVIFQVTGKELNELLSNSDWNGGNYKVYEGEFVGNIVKDVNYKVQ